jgi:hypothetical protein
VERSEKYRQKAEQCRRLAEAITARDDPAIAALLKLAVEWDAKALKGMKAVQTG